MTRRKFRLGTLKIVMLENKLLLVKKTTIYTCNQITMGTDLESAN